MKVSEILKTKGRSVGDVVKNRLAEIELETGVLRDLYIARRH